MSFQWPIRGALWMQGVVGKSTLEWNRTQLNINTFILMDSAAYLLAGLIRILTIGTSHLSSGCGSVDILVTSFTRGPWFESSHRQNLYWTFVSCQLSIAKTKIKKKRPLVAAIALWFCLRLPSCSPGFESPAHHLCFFQFVLWHCNKKGTKINKKRPGLAHSKKEAGDGHFYLKSNNLKNVRVWF